MISGKSFSPAVASLAARMTRLRGATGGMAAVEFAMVLPIMVGMYLGCCEVSSGFSASKKVDAAARALSDLTAQAAVDIQQSDMTDIIAAATGVMQPFDGSAAPLTITSFIMPTPLPLQPVRAYTDWSYVRGGAAVPCGDQTAVVPAGFLAAGRSVVKADVAYNYMPLLAGPFHTIGTGSTTQIALHATIWMEPRVQQRVKLAGGVPGTCSYIPAKSFP